MGYRSRWSANQERVCPTTKLIRGEVVVAALDDNSRPSATIWKFELRWSGIRTRRLSILFAKRVAHYGAVPVLNVSFRTTKPSNGTTMFGNLRQSVSRRRVGKFRRRVSNRLAPREATELRVLNAPKRGGNVANPSGRSRSSHLLARIYNSWH
jgi:hypothetical protein